MTEPTDEEVEQANKEYEDKHGQKILSSAERRRIKNDNCRNI